MYYINQIIHPEELRRSSTGMNIHRNKSLHIWNIESYRNYSALKEYPLRLYASSRFSVNLLNVSVK